MNRTALSQCSKLCHRIAGPTALALELRARADLNQAIAQLERSTGGTLEWHGVKIQ